MNTRARGARRPLTYLTTALLALASSSAMALGLGDIRVLSRPGQPLVAEIPVISADPAELQNLRVGLASPVTFERVGLQRPGGLVSELQFELTRNAQGRAIIRVTSQTPVDTPALAFLIEADWGQGRLVREYSALVDAPSTAQAVSEPEIVAPAGALSSVIERGAAGGAPSVASAPAPAAQARTAPATPAPARAVAADGTVTVQAGQTLSAIAQDVARGAAVDRDRAMIALLRANPEAFIRGNVNLLRQGAVLRVPDAGQLQAIDAVEAAAMVREHTAQWRQARSVPQPATAAAPAAPAVAPTAAAPADAPGARLEIAPAVAAEAADAGTTTGTGEGNGGDMLGNDQLRQAREDLATRDAEISELRQRVAELEQLQQKQQALVSLRDTDLAAAQARLGQTQSSAADSAAREGGTPWFWLGLPLLIVALLVWWLSRRRKPSPLPPLERVDRDDTALSVAVPAGASLDVLAERGTWQEDPPADQPMEARWQADAQPDAGAVDTGAAPADTPGHTPHGNADAPLDADETPSQVDPHALPSWVYAPTTATAGAEDARSAHAPSEATWFAPPEPAPVALHLPLLDVVPAYAREAAQQPEFRGVFEYPAHTDVASGDDRDAPAPMAHGAPTGEAGNTSADAPAPVAASLPHEDSPGWRAAHDRLELAIAYLDLGEEGTARGLLMEVIQHGDPQLREQARELLARID